MTKKDKITFKRSWNQYSSDWETVAVIHNVPANPGMVMSYLHFGQHSEADIDWVNELPDCPPADYLPLQAELISIGYTL